ncbi:similar to mitochondrial ribosomal protein S11 (predicted), isoform CRA_c [Rattus norvegicus]|uniref:Similar to mitochondrial ribosomal protein S11 (Predicted), isoform CRA_c n=1 Tax=Rattus norvegicus TaxID=10116 RepID=A6JC28_RAT|nr:similar to mitochondrial ribosomal protein S11 (predicted), isoform CRA_c [Rattus norvegicus]
MWREIRHYLQMSIRWQCSAVTVVPWLCSLIYPCPLGPSILSFNLCLLPPCLCLLLPFTPCLLETVARDWAAALSQEH